MFCHESVLCHWRRCKVKKKKSETIFVMKKEANVSFIQMYPFHSLEN